MFDDIKNQPSSGGPRPGGQQDGQEGKNSLPESGQLVSPPVSGERTHSSQAPGAVPAPEPPQSRPAGQVEDIFAETDKYSSAGGAEETQGQLNKPPVFQPKESSGNKKLAEASQDNSQQSGVVSKKYIMAGIFILAFAAVLVGAWYGYSHFFRFRIKGNVPVYNLNDGQEQNTNQEQAVNEEGKEETDQSLQDLIFQHEAASPVSEQSLDSTRDSDQDGLTDIEEMRMGMNINSNDSDGDGLFDREEVKVYGTDPLNRDTDGDGYLDGVEVENGFNPKGPGKLFNIK
jgi:hypothetical protein